MIWKILTEGAEARNLCPLCTLCPFHLSTKSTSVELPAFQKKLKNGLETRGMDTCASLSAAKMALV